MIADTVAADHAARRRVLVLDDEPQILDAISDLLEDDFEVLTQTDAEGALELLDAQRVGVIISDERMPRISGHEFLRRARDRSEAVRVLITGYADLTALVRAVNEGKIYGYVAKPWDPEELRTMVFKAAEVFRLLQDLDHERQLLAVLMENIPDGIYFKDAQSRYTRVNRAYAHLLGAADPAHVVGKVAGDFVDPARAARYAANDRRVLMTGEPVIDEVDAVRTAAGAHWYATTKVPIRQSDGQVTGLVGVSRDITVHKQAEERAVLNLALQELRNAVLEMAGPGNWATLIAAFHGLLGRFVAFDACSVVLVDLESRRCDAYTGVGGQLAKTMREGVPAPLERALATGEPCYRRNADEMRRAGDDASLLDGGTQSVVDIPFQGGTVAVSSQRPEAFDERDIEVLRQFALVMSAAHRRLQDLSALARKEEELRQSQKMEAIGQLAGGIAHDFNNLITVIGGYSELMLRTLHEQDPNRNGAEQIRHAGQQAHSLIRRLLAFSRREVPEPVVLDVNQVVTDLQKMLGRLIGERYSLGTDLSRAVPRVRADPGQVEQIVMNLVINARDAMPDGGPVVVETADERVGDGPEGVQAAPGRYLRLTVRDTGVGMDAQIRARIFEPFFTTKEAGKGTGLGLSTVYGIVKQSDGFILVDSAPGAGAAFHVYLPACADEAQAARPGDAGATSAGGSGQTILLVDDDDMVRQVTARMLRHRGYRVLEAGDGESCLARFAAASEPIDLLATDVVLPGMNGCQLAGQLQGRHPAMGVLYITGFLDDEVVRREILERRQAFLQKPFTIDSLIAKVRSALAMRPSRGDSL